MFDTNKPLPKIGVDMFYFAILSADPAEGTPTYATPIRVPGLVQVGFNPNSQAGTFFGDNGPYATAAQTGDLTMTVGLADIPPELRAIWFGQTITDGVLSETQINPPDMAIGYRVKKSSGGYRYIWAMKGKAAPPAESNDTQGASINFQSDSITINCSMLVSTGEFRRMMDAPGDMPQWFSSPTWVPSGASGAAAPMGAAAKAEKTDTPK